MSVQVDIVDQIELTIDITDDVITVNVDDGITIAKNGVAVSNTRYVDFKEGSNVTLTVVQQGNKVLVTIASSGGAAGSGDVVGPNTSTDSDIALFDGVTGKLLKVLSGSNDDIAQRKSGVWTNRTLAQFRADLVESAVLTMHADNTVSVTLTNQPNSEQPLGNVTRSYVRFDATVYTKVRLHTRVITLSASANSPRIYPQYSLTLDGSGSWVTIGTGATSEAVSLSSAVNVSSDWITLPAAAKADILFRVAQNGGDGAADPAVGNVYLEFKTN